jgi:hypothetical protein
VIEQVQNVCLTTIVRDAGHGAKLSVHGWVYSLRTAWFTTWASTSIHIQARRALRRRVARVNAYQEIAKMRDAIRTETAPAVGQYRTPRVGDLLFLSGIGPRDVASNAIVGHVHDARVD